jgi:hypothetical protein
MTKLLRVRNIYGLGNPIPVGKTAFWENFVYHEGGEENVPGTNTPRLKLVNIGERAVAAFDDEVAALVEGLRAARDKTHSKPRKSTAQQQRAEQHR